MRIAYSAMATVTATGDTPTQNTARQAMCRKTNGVARSQSMRPSLRSPTMASAACVSNQHRSASKRRFRASGAYGWGRGRALVLLMIASTVRCYGSIRGRWADGCRLVDFFSSRAMRRQGQRRGGSDFLARCRWLLVGRGKFDANRLAPALCIVHIADALEAAQTVVGGGIAQVDRWRGKAVPGIQAHPQMPYQLPIGLAIGCALDAQIHIGEPAWYQERPLHAAFAGETVPMRTDVGVEAGIDDGAVPGRQRFGPQGRLAVLLHVDVALSFSAAYAFAIAIAAIDIVEIRCRSGPDRLHQLAGE